MRAVVSIGVEESLSPWMRSVGTEIPRNSGAKVCFGKHALEVEHRFQGGSVDHHSHPPVHDFRLARFEHFQRRHRKTLELRSRELYCVSRSLGDCRASWEPSELSRGPANTDFVDGAVQVPVAPPCCLTGTVSGLGVVKNSAAERVAAGPRAACGNATAPSSNAAPSAVNTE